MTSKENISAVKGRRLLVSILIVGGLFFIMGFISWMNAILIPYFKVACELSNFASYLVAFAFYISYFVMSVPAGYLLKKQGFRKGMMYGFFIMAVGAFIFVPAAMTRSYETFLLGLFSLGAGLAIRSLRIQSTRNAAVCRFLLASRQDPCAVPSWLPPGHNVCGSRLEQIELSRRFRQVRLAPRPAAAH